MKVLLAVGLSILVCAVQYLLWNNHDIGLADEGYLWYGVKHTVAGEVPLRDFQSYDPGRYYWCAAFAPLVGDGLRGVRFAAGVFQTIGLAFALLVALRFARGAPQLVSCALLLVLWQFPRHKLFEPALASMAIWFAVRLIEQPSTGRHLAAGLFAGLAGFFGRNHGLYAAVATGLLIALCVWKERGWKEHAGEWLKRSGAWALGGLAGYAPMWAMMAFVPGFAAGFMKSNLIILQHGSNVPLPYPWPWRTNWGRLAGWDLFCGAGLSAMYLLPVIVLPIGLIVSLRLSRLDLRARAATVASTFLGLFYVHHVAVRAHPTHLAECLPPVLLLTLALTARPRPRWLQPAGWGALAAVSALALLAASPLARFRPGAPDKDRVECEVDGEKLMLPTGTARSIETVRKVVGAAVPPDESLFIAPGRPSFYPILGKSSPTWWIYFLWPATEEEERDLIAELAAKKVDWVLIADHSVDDVETRRFANTHPKVWQHLWSDFELLAPGYLPKWCFLFHRRG